MCCGGTERSNIVVGCPNEIFGALIFFSCIVKMQNELYSETKCKINNFPVKFIYDVERPDRKSVV